MKDIVINLQKFDTWKTQLTIEIHFISSKDVDEERVMHSKSNNIEFMSYDNANEVVNELFESLLSRCQWEGVVLFSIQFNCCIKNVTR